MAKIPDKQFPTLAAVDLALETAQESQSARDYIGMSSIGEPCSRKLWYRLNRPAEKFSANTLRIFNDGHRAETEMARLLRLVPGIELITHDDHGNQFALGDGFLSGHMDGVIRGVIEAPKKWHIWEHKAVNEKKFNDLKKLRSEKEKTALEKWDKIYYAQAVSYMHSAEITRHFLTVSTPGVRDYISVRTDENPEMAKALIEKARRIKKVKTPPERIGGKDFYLCKWCAFYDECHG